MSGLQRRALLAAGFGGWLGAVPARTAVPRERRVGVGDLEVRLLEEGAPGAPVVLVNVHEDESTSVQAARQAWDPQRHRLLRLQGQGRRLLEFHLEGRRFRFDPNRIFSPAGIELTLKKYGGTSPAAQAAVARLADALVQAMVPAQGLALGPARLIVALHNNRRGYTMDSYGPKGEYAGEAAAVARQPGADAGDFFLVTQRDAFDALQRAGFNAVLQRPEPRDDGSMSVRWAGPRPRYVNVEARHDHGPAQRAMLEALLALAPRWTG